MKKPTEQGEGGGFRAHKAKLLSNKSANASLAAPGHWKLCQLLFLSALFALRPLQKSQHCSRRVSWGTSGLQGRGLRLQTSQDGPRGGGDLLNSRCPVAQEGNSSSRSSGEAWSPLRRVSLLGILSKTVCGLSPSAGTTESQRETDVSVLITRSL